MTKHIATCHNLSDNEFDWGTCDCADKTVVGRIRVRLFDALYARLSRKERVVNPADPTLVVSYGIGGWRRRLRTRRFDFDMVVSWGVEARVTVFGRTWRTYDNRFFCWLFGGLEDAYNREQMAYDEDPMGPLSRYV
jgi:hypothetical protein